jgi:hypothetical protein
MAMSVEAYVQYMRRQRDDAPLYLFDKTFATTCTELGKEYVAPAVFEEDLFALLGDGRPDHRCVYLLCRQSVVMSVLSLQQHQHLAPPRRRVCIAVGTCAKCATTGSAEVTCCEQRRPRGWLIAGPERSGCDLHKLTGSRAQVAHRRS